MTAHNVHSSCTNTYSHTLAHTHTNMYSYDIHDQVFVCVCVYLSLFLSRVLSMHTNMSLPLFDAEFVQTPVNCPCEICLLSTRRHSFVQCMRPVSSVVLTAATAIAIGPTSSGITDTTNALCSSMCARPDRTGMIKQVNSIRDHR